MKSTSLLNHFLLDRLHPKMSDKKEQKINDAARKNLLNESISSIIGKQGDEVINFLDTEKYVNEFLIAKKLDNNINQTRNLLYRLSEHGLVSSTRKKDKKKGWYTYFWKLEALKALEFLKEILRKRIDQTSHQIQSREIKTFYICEKCNIEHNEENALIHDFTCSECGSIFVLRDNTKIIKELRKNLEKQQRELNIIDAEIGREKEKGDKKKVKEIKKEENEKVRKRLEKKIERQKLKAKEAKLLAKPKKPVQKKKLKSQKKKASNKKKR